MSHRPTKYAAVCATLPRLGIDPERRDVVEACRREVLAAEPLAAGDDAIEIDLADASRSVKLALARAKQLSGGQRYASSFARQYALLREVKALISEWLSDANLLIEAVEGLMTEQMEVEGVASQRLVDGGSVSMSYEPYASVKDKELYRRWCATPTDRCYVCGVGAEEHGNGHDFTPGAGLERSMHLWPSTTTALVKERLLDGQPEPPGVEAYSMVNVRLNRG